MIPKIIPTVADAPCHRNHHVARSLRGEGGNKSDAFFTSLQLYLQSADVCFTGLELYLHHSAKKPEGTFVTAMGKFRILSPLISGAPFDRRSNRSDCAAKHAISPPCDEQLRKRCRIISMQRSGQAVAVYGYDAACAHGKFYLPRSESTFNQKELNCVCGDIADMRGPSAT